MNRSSDFSGKTLSAYWDAVSRSLENFSAAPSTKCYFDYEKALFERYFQPLEGRSLFKSDLWNEAKNTHILKWAIGRGVRVYGVDISFNVALEARRNLNGAGGDSGVTVSDVRQMPFADDSFDYLYSMGTIEHFPDHHLAVRECHRVLRKGGTGVIGVINRYDPFLRPLLIYFLNLFGLYPYGYEESFSFRSFERSLTSAGFQVVDKTSIMFMPGALRMADVYFHARKSVLGALTGRLVALFVFLHRKLPFLKRHGYLIVCVVRK